MKLKGDGDDITVVGDTDGSAKMIQITDTNGDADLIVDYFYHEEIRGTENTGKRNR